MDADPVNRMWTEAQSSLRVKAGKRPRRIPRAASPRLPAKPSASRGRGAKEPPTPRRLGLASTIDPDPYVSQQQPPRVSTSERVGRVPRSCSVTLAALRPLLVHKNSFLHTPGDRKVRERLTAPKYHPTHMRTHTHTHVHTRTLTHMCTRAHPHTLRCVHTHTHTYTCAHTHAHTIAFAWKGLSRDCEESRVEFLCHTDVRWAMSFFTGDDVFLNIFFVKRQKETWNRERH